MGLANAYEAQHQSNLKKFLADVIGVVEATSYEKLMLWDENRRRDAPKTWVSEMSGMMETVGFVGDMPVCISMFTAVVDGQKVLFLEATSAVVDHRMVKAWLKENLPESALQPGGEYINKQDANNFHNVFRYR